MTRDEALALYRPIRATIRRIISLAVPACDRADFMRAAKQLGLWADGAIVYPDDKAAEMLGDVALFSNRTNVVAVRLIVFFQGGHGNSTPPTLNLLNEWGRRFSPCFAAWVSTRRQEFGLMIFSMETEGFG